MTEKLSADKRNAFYRTLAHTVVTPLVGSTLAVVYATGQLDLRALATGLAITGTLALLWQFDRWLIYPRLQAISQDWLRIEMETFISMTEHLVGALLALMACGYVFGFRVEPAIAWLLLVGIVLVFSVLHSTEQTVNYYRQLKEKERLELDLKRLATQAELRALRAQINPHFLFNTLNTIAALIHSNPILAESSVERLAKIFRHTLNSSEREQVSLAEELDFVDDYLEIERARFGERLRITREIESLVTKISVPSLILQPLVENAITHGCDDDGSIDLDIRIRSVDEQAVITIADRGEGMSLDHKIGDSPGHGLRNVDERLRRLYGDGLELRSNTPHGTVAIVKIPRGEKHNADSHRR